MLAKSAKTSFLGLLIMLGSICTANAAVLCNQDTTNGPKIMTTLLDSGSTVKAQWQLLLKSDWHVFEISKAAAEEAGYSLGGLQSFISSAGVIVCVECKENKGSLCTKIAVRTTAN